MSIGAWQGLWIAGLGLFWIGMLGLLWRRSLIGMLVGVSIGWLSVSVSAIAFVRAQPDPAALVAGSAWVLCVAAVGLIQIVLGLSIVFARITRRGSLDAQDAGLLEG